MGILDRFFGPPTKDEFAAIMAGALRNAGDAREWAYDKTEFRLLHTRDGKEAGVTNLRNLFTEYCELPRRERNAWLAQACEDLLNRMQQMADLEVHVNSIESVRLIKGRIRQVEFLSSPSHATLIRLLRLFKEHDQEFALYDALMYPNGRDPGAYFYYSPRESNADVWRMTFGNHGWGGGIYEIEENTICRQLKDLVRKNRLQTIDLDEVMFCYRDYKKTVAESDRVNKELLSAHAGDETPPQG